MSTPTLRCESQYACHRMELACTYVFAVHIVSIIHAIPQRLRYSQVENLKMKARTRLLGTKSI